jgi:superfamily II DNA/RNA helicase
MRDKHNEKAYKGSLDSHVSTFSRPPEKSGKKHLHVLILTCFVQKREADDLVAELGMILKGTEALHGDIPQGLREKILSGFRTGRIPVLIATDVAARGLDIDHIDLVVHYGVPRVSFDIYF